LKAVAVLTIPSLKLEVPVFDNDDELSLNRGAGLVAGMGRPDTGGNVGIAGHRDGFFRALKDIKVGDEIVIRTQLKLHRYRVTSIDIVEKFDNRLLADTELPGVTLVTCYPFYFVGNAPQRYIVAATYVWPSDS
jgi:sortase A